MRLNVSYSEVLCLFHILNFRCFDMFTFFFFRKIAKTIISGNLSNETKTMRVNKARRVEMSYPGCCLGRANCLKLL